jgi:transketolase
MQTPQLKKLATQFRIEVLEATHKANSGHPTSALSALEIMTLLYFGDIDGTSIMKYDHTKPQWSGRDYFILSKGHSCPALYVILANLGFFPKEELNHLRQINSLLEGHPVNKIPGLAAAPGPLGQGLSFGNGIALALKMDKKPNRAYVVLGDGELQEGQIWEAALTSAQHKLDNLTVFVDSNKLQQTNFVRAIKQVEPIGQKFAAFGWNVINIADGHDFDQLREGVRKAWKTKLRPTVIICKTVKGKGIPFAEHKASYHGVPLSKEEMAEAVKVLERELR